MTSGIWDRIPQQAELVHSDVVLLKSWSVPHSEACKQVRFKN
jgi:hypothetical protein